MDPAAHAARRAAITAELRARTGVDEAMIDAVVRGFYARVRDDAALGPVFAARITDWEPHLQKMCAFWSSVALMTGVYHGQPMRKHLPLPVDAAHFDRWLALFAETVTALCPPAAAQHLMEKAMMIAASIEMGVATAHGVRLAPGERFRNPALAPG